MNSRTAYLIQIIDKIGGPLLNAVSKNSASNGADVNEAQNLASLLGKTVQLSIELGKMIEVEKLEAEQSDSLRIALAGLASPLIADQFKNLSKTPGDAELQKITHALEAVMTFSDNFTPSRENAERLANVSANGLPADAHQINVQYLQAFAPVAHVITSFSFGQTEKKMAQETAEKITSKSKTIVAEIFGDGLDEDQRKLAELALVKSLAEMYVSCHTSEMNKLMALQEPDANAQTNAHKAVWDGFDARAEILGTLSGNLVPKSSGTGTAPSASPVAVATATPTQAAPSTPPQEQSAPSPTTEQPPQSPISQVVQQPPAQEQPPAPPAEQQPVAPPPSEPPPQQQSAASANPMSMFAKPKADGEQSAPPPSAPPTQEQPAAAPPQQPVAPPTEQQSPPAQPPAQPPAEGAQGEQGSGGGGPMSFFKTPPKEEGES